MNRLLYKDGPKQNLKEIVRNKIWDKSDSTQQPRPLNDHSISQMHEIIHHLDDKRFEECASVMRKMDVTVLRNILTDFPIKLLHDSIPQSLAVLDVLYTRLHQSYKDNFPSQKLQTEQLISKLVLFLANQWMAADKGEKNCNSYFPTCRNILWVVSAVIPCFKEQLKEKKQALDKCIQKLGQHGIVETSCGKLKDLHGGLQFEIEQIVQQYKLAIKKLLEFSGKQTLNVPSESSHQRMLQVTCDEIHTRIFQNTTLHSIIQPTLQRKYLQKLTGILSKRMQDDKMILVCYMEVRKICNEKDASKLAVSVTLQKFFQGYSTALKLLTEVTNDPELQREDGSDDDIFDDLMSSLRSHSVQNKSKISAKGGSTICLIEKDPREKIRSTSSSIAGKERISSGGLALRPRHSSSSTIQDLMALTSDPHKPQSMETSSIANFMLETGSSFLQREVQNLRIELEQARETIRKLQETEKQLRDRLSEQAQKQFTITNSHFEDLSLGEKRPTQLIRLYGNLYSDSRVDALDSLESLLELENLDVLKAKLLFSVIVLAFRSTRQSLTALRNKLHQLLCMPVENANQPCQDQTSLLLQGEIDEYIRKTVDRHDPTQNVEEVCSQIYSTLYDYPCLKQCPGLHQYIEECNRIAWALSVQNPPFTIQYDSRIFHVDLHSRFHTSDSSSDEIKEYLWPALLEGESGPCVHRAVVIT